MEEIYIPEAEASKQSTLLKSPTFFSRHSFDQTSINSTVFILA